MQYRFYSALPVSTIDFEVKKGADIVIEQRPENELTCVNGVRLSPEGIPVWNPSFDVTPANLIKDIFTDKGLFSDYKE